MWRFRLSSRTTMAFDGDRSTSSTGRRRYRDGPTGARRPSRSASMCARNAAALATRPERPSVQHHRVDGRDRRDGDIADLEPSQLVGSDRLAGSDLTERRAEPRHLGPAGPQVGHLSRLPTLAQQHGARCQPHGLGVAGVRPSLSAASRRRTAGDRRGCGARGRRLISNPQSRGPG